MATYFGSIDFGALADATRRDRRRILENFRESHGEKNFAGLERKHVEIMLAAKASTPHAAKNFLKALRAVVTVALRAGLRDDDPTAESESRSAQPRVIGPGAKTPSRNSRRLIP